MELFSLVWRQYRWSFLGVIALSLLNATPGIGLIAFISLRLTTAIDTSLRVLPEFLGLLGLLMAVTLDSQLALITLDHHFIYRLRSEFVKCILDTQIEQVEKIGSTSSPAGLVSDIRNITIALVYLPELVQGVTLTFGPTAYLAWLSGEMTLVITLWMTLIIWGGFVLVSRMHKHMASLHEVEDKLYHGYQMVLKGRKELTLDRERVEYMFNQLYLPDAREYRHHIVRANTFHLGAVNWSDATVLGAIGLVFWIANSLDWTDTAVAATHPLTLLFLHTLLFSVVDTLPTLLSAQVVFNKLRQFSLAPYQAELPRLQAYPDWQTLELRDATFHYPNRRFAVGPLNLTLKRGELVLLIGGNGSSKPTLAMFLTGLYQPVSGQILVDGQPLAADKPEEYRKLFSAVFTDVWLFDRLLGSQGEEVDPALVAMWLERLQMAHELQLENGKIADLRLSRGQKRRVALLLVLAGSRDIILLDEWTVDQDPHFRREFYQVLLPLMWQMGKAIFAIDHDDHCFQHADHLLEIRAGQLSELTGEERAQASRDVVARTA